MKMIDAPHKGFENRLAPLLVTDLASFAPLLDLAPDTSKLPPLALTRIVRHLAQPPQLTPEASELLPQPFHFFEDLIVAAVGACGNFLPFRLPIQPIEISPQALDFVPKPAHRPVLPVAVGHRQLLRRLKLYKKTVRRQMVDLP